MSDSNEYRQRLFVKYNEVREMLDVLAKRLEDFYFDWSLVYNTENRYPYFTELAAKYEQELKTKEKVPASRLIPLNIFREMLDELGDIIKEETTGG